MKNFLFLVAVLSLITIPVLLLVMPHNTIIDSSVAFFLWYPFTIIFIIFVYVKMTNKINLFLLPLSFIPLVIIHYVAGFLFVSLYSNPHPEAMWYYVWFLAFYTLPFCFITFVISIIIEIIKYKMKQ